MDEWKDGRIKEWIDGSMEPMKSMHEEETNKWMDDIL